MLHRCNIGSRTKGPRTPQLRRTQTMRDLPFLPPLHQVQGRPVWVGLFVAMTSLPLVLAACGGASPQAAPPTTTTSTQASGTQHTTVPSSGSGSGVEGRPGSTSAQGSAGNESTGSYSLAFARCMQAHGVANFPNPNGSGSQLGPSSGIDPTSTAFQAALDGPCQSLAPQGWISSGPVSR